MRIRLLIAALVGVIIVVSGCAGVPSSSAPQAIGTVELPPPKQLPEPNASMTPEQTLREFLKATADPADLDAVDAVAVVTLCGGMFRVHSSAMFGVHRCTSSPTCKTSPNASKSKKRYAGVKPR